MAQKATNLMTVAEMIEATFGTGDTNIVHFKLLRTILLLLARQLRLLNRQVIVETDVQVKAAGSHVKIAEIKLDGTTKVRQDNAKSEPIEGTSVIRQPYNKMSMRTLSHTNYLNDDLISQNSKLPLAKSESSLGVQKYHKILEKLEVQRERVLRVINQRKTSNSEGMSLTSPMLSLSSSERNLQKLFIVEPEDGRVNYGIVTNEQFTELCKKVDYMENRIGRDNFGPLEFPENIKLMQELREGASLTDAMAALQISARIDAAEKAIATLSDLIETGDGAQCRPNDRTLDTMAKTRQDDTFHDYITKENIQILLDNEKDLIFQKMNYQIGCTISVLETNVVQKLESKLNEVITVKERFDEMEQNLEHYSNHLIDIDTGLTFQVSAMQEQINHVKLELDAGLQNMVETLANKGIDTELISDLQNHLENLKIEVEKENAMQVTLTEFQLKLATEIDTLKREIELLFETKSDREEVLDALRDKAGVEQLNGMISQDQHSATYASIVRLINHTQSMFRAQENVWQKVIDELEMNINRKVDLPIMTCLRDNIQKHLNDLKQKIESILASLGEPLSASISRKIYRDSKCLSCSNPAHITPPEPAVPFLPPLKPHGAGETPTLLGQGDQAGKCIAGLPVQVKHTINDRRELCTRYCGGSHTIQRNAGASVRHTSNMRLQGRPLQKPEVIDIIDNDGTQVYKLDEKGILEKPCIPCNYPSLDGCLDERKPPRNRSLEKLNHTSDGRCECAENSELPPMRNVSFNSSVPPMDQLSTNMPLASFSLAMDNNYLK